MKIKIQVVIELENGQTQVIQEVAQIERGALQAENLGLSLAEAKILLHKTQSTLIEQQVATYLAENSSCLHCKKLLGKSNFEMSQMAKGLNQTESEADIPKQIERIKWCRHGNVFKGQQAIDNLVDDLEIEVFDDDSQLETKKLFKMAMEFQTYISNNQHYIPNYGERWRNGEAIATGFVESTVNQVISKRFVKKQQMRWTPKGAHLLLQVRISVLNEELQGKFKQWYPGLKQAA